MVPPPPIVDIARTAVRPALRTAVDRLSPRLRAVAGYHFGWLDRDGNPADRSAGKALRPALAFLSARAAGSDGDAALPAAVAVELVHNSSLLHDDLIDEDTTRHHRPTVWSVFGMPDAVLTGDALLNLAYQVLADGTPGSPAATACLAGATGRLLTGQAADVTFEDRTDVTLDECVRMAEHKTAALLGCAASIGSAYVCGPQATTSALCEYGKHLGLAFQLVDDLLGIWGTTEATGKPVLADLRARKKSLPVVYALNADDPAARELAATYAQPDLDERALRRCADLVTAAGGRTWAEHEATSALDRAAKVLEEAPVPDDVRAELTAVARYVTARTH